jgi:hypothetical protein
MERALLDLFTSTKPEGLGLVVVNLVGSLIVLIWTAGIRKHGRDERVWRGWMVFWGTTSLAYLLMIVLRHRGSGFAWFGFYASTASLLVTYGLSDAVPAGWHRYAVRAGIGTVLASAIADEILISHGREPGWHQTLAGAAMFLWAWKLRRRDSGKSVVLIVYALAQFPIQPFFLAVGLGPSQSYPEFVAATFLLYALLKLGLIPSIYALIEKAALHGEAGSA